MAIHNLNYDSEGNHMNMAQSGCPRGYYPLDDGRYCQHHSRGPSGPLFNKKGQSHEPNFPGQDGIPQTIPSRLLSRNFIGTVNELAREILNLNNQFFNRSENMSRVLDQCERFYQDVRNGEADDYSCKICLDGTDVEGKCIAGVCISQWMLSSGKRIECDLKLRY